MVLILLQSIAVVADAHQFHQTGSEHLEFDQHRHQQLDEHASRLTELDLSCFLDSSASEDKNSDCHHCCHCHSASATSITSQAVSLFDMTRTRDATPYYSALTVAQPSSLYRPPSVHSA